MMNKENHKKPLTSTERGLRFESKHKHFDIKRIYFRASASQRLLIDQLKEVTGCHSREELIIEALREHGLKHGLTFAKMAEDLKCLKQS